ncbi:hypothetical protein GH742_08920 [Legionella sp. MW5194]|uniref:sterol desaturase family protein n=1 Tax=Legionella sp. MW5194 TaxID=2662448 RepID=UPI00193C8EC7|nr:sterol desaturase family protein [Legionella sp. MW5194]QRN03978.1 hypothetical protein GH742_08920 [Legionella sp. MW5194]
MLKNEYLGCEFARDTAVLSGRIMTEYDIADLDFYNLLLTLAFFLIISSLIALEYVARLHHLGKAGFRRRRLLNWSIGLINIFSAYPISNYFLAYYCEINNIGLLNSYGAPFWLVFIVWFIISDLIYYTHHRLGHSVNIFWYFHQIHHSDKSPNITTTFRLHPLDFLSLLITRSLCVIIFGPCLLAFAIINFSHTIISFFSHSNVRINDKFERILCQFIVTPRYHLQHHTKAHCNKNFATVLTVWDKIGDRQVPPLLGDIDRHQLAIGIDTEIDFEKFKNLLLINDVVHWFKNHYSSYFPFVLGILLFVFIYWLVCMVFPPLSQGFIGINVWAFLIILFFTVHLSLLTISIYLHRSETHRALKFHPVITHLFRFWLWLATGTNRREWVAIHRLHHQDPDGKNDPHSPVNLGIKTLFLSGIEIYNSAKTEENVKQLGVIRNDDFLERHLYGKFSMAGPLVLMLIYIAFFGIWGVPLWFLQMILQIILQASVINGLGHYYGYRNFDTQDNSHNLTRFGLFIMGEELHNNHHGNPSSCKFSYQSNEWDLGWFYILILEYLGLATLKKQKQPDHDPSLSIFNPFMSQWTGDKPQSYRRESITTIDRKTHKDG